MYKIDEAVVDVSLNKSEANLKSEKGKLTILDYDDLSKEEHSALPESIRRKIQLQRQLIRQQQLRKEQKER